MDMNSSSGMEMDTGMYMTFQPWETYKVTMMFDSWKIETRWHYALTWLLVALAAAFFHVLRFASFKIRGIMYSTYVKIDAGGSSRKNPSRKIIWKWRLVHSVVAGTSYGYALMLMLVAMTYNPGLFLALCVGYGIGDFMLPPENSQPDLSDSVAQCCTD